MVTGGKLQLKGGTWTKSAQPCTSMLHIQLRQRCRQHHGPVFLVSFLPVLLLTGGNPWDVKKKKAKKKKPLKVDEAEEGDILENGDIRTKGGYLLYVRPGCPHM